MTCPDSVSKMDNLIEKQYGQDVIDSLSVLEAVVPTFHQDLWPKLAELLPTILLALRSRFAIIRQCSARCFATICHVMTVDAMHFVIQKVVPYLGDTSNLSNRQGATELIYRQSVTLSSALSNVPIFRRHCAEVGYQSPPICNLHDCPCSGENE